MRRLQQAFGRMRLPGLAILFAAACSGCAGPSPSERDRPTNRPVGTFWSPSSTISWATARGAGGAEVPPLPALRIPGDRSLDFSRLKGVIFPPGGEEILFVGVQESGRRSLNPDDLLEALVVALRALPGAPGVSIDPTGTQLTRGLDEDDQMNVRYIGSDERTIVGLVAFEADRWMKSLSFGKDNITKQPVTSAVPGYRSELDLIADQPDSSGDAEWHRFWIEQDSTWVDVSRDGTTVLLDTVLGVRTEYMKAEGGELVPGGRAPSPMVQAFADHLTDNYHAYADDVDAYQDLHAFAQMTSLALAVTDTSGAAPEEIMTALSELDVTSLSGHDVRDAETPLRTPATIARRETTTGRTRAVYTLTGGVDLTPRNRYRTRNRDADQMQQDVLRARLDDPYASGWRVLSGDETLIVAPRSLASQSLRMWQTDMTVGPVEFAREFPGRRVDAGIGQHWRPRVPALSISSEVVNIEGLGPMPASITIEALSSGSLTLGQHETVTLPGQPQVQAFTGTYRRRRLALHLFANRWILFDGEPRFVDRGAGLVMEVPEGVVVVEFEPDAPHRALNYQTSAGQYELLWEGDRLQGYSAASGESIELVYDAEQIVALRGSDGQTVEYRLDELGRLRSVVDLQGDAVSYELDETGGPPRGVYGDIVLDPGARATFGRAAIASSPVWDQLVSETGRLSNQDVVFIAVRDAPADADHRFEVVVGGQPVQPWTGELKRQAQGVFRNRLQTSDTARRFREAFLDSDAAAGRLQIVVVGPPSLRQDIARALQALEPGRSISTAEDPVLAARNLTASAGDGYQHVHLESGLSQPIRDRLRRLERGGGEQGLVILSGHNARQLKSLIEERGRAGALQGKDVFLLTCGEPGDGCADRTTARGRSQARDQLRTTHQRQPPCTVHGASGGEARRARCAGVRADRRGDS